MSIIERLKDLSPKGYQPTEKEIETNQLLQSMRLECEKLLIQYGTEFKNPNIKLSPFGKTVFISKLTDSKDDPLTISLTTMRFSNPKKSPGIIMKTDKTDTYLVLGRDFSIIRNGQETVREANREDTEIYQELIDALKKIHPLQ